MSSVETREVCPAEAGPLKKDVSSMGFLKAAVLTEKSDVQTFQSRKVVAAIRDAQDLKVKLTAKLAFSTCKIGK